MLYRFFVHSHVSALAILTALSATPTAAVALSTTPTAAVAPSDPMQYCPSVQSISRADQSYHWSSNEPGWDGAFISPVMARGFSREINRFIEARWVQLYEAHHPTGYIECLYEGNLSGEIIKFTQQGSISSRPAETFFWQENERQINYPAVKQSCTSSERDCAFSNVQGRAFAHLP